MIVIDSDLVSSKRKEEFKSEVENLKRFSSFLRFELFDKKKRTFHAERQSYTGKGGWVSMFQWGTLQELVDLIVPAIETDEFFDLSG